MAMSEQSVEPSRDASEQITGRGPWPAVFDTIAQPSAEQFGETRESVCYALDCPERERRRAYCSQKQRQNCRSGFVAEV